MAVHAVNRFTKIPIDYLPTDQLIALGSSILT